MLTKTGEKARKFIFLFQALAIAFFSWQAMAADEKPGRFFLDQPDLNGDYMIHFIYLVTKKDNEWDINGDMEREILRMNEEFYALTGNKQRFKFDMRENGDLDISFVRLDRKARSVRWNNNYPDYYLQTLGFNNPKKLYYTYADYNHRTDGGQMKPHHGWLFLKRGRNKVNPRQVNRRITTVIHELVHGNGFSFHCTTSDDDGHNGNGHTRQDSIISFEYHESAGTQASLEREYVLGDMIYDHSIKGCPDLKDSVYLTPTSENSYDPLALHCFLAEKSGRGVPGEKFEWPERYDHQAFDRTPEGRYWCSYKLSKYAKPESFESFTEW